MIGDVKKCLLKEVKETEQEGRESAKPGMQGSRATGMVKPSLSIFSTSLDPLQFCLDNVSDELRAPVDSNGGVDALFLAGEKPDHKLIQIHFRSATMRHVREIFLILLSCQNPLFADHI